MTTQTATIPSFDFEDIDRMAENLAVKTDIDIRDEDTLLEAIDQYFAGQPIARFVDVDDDISKQSTFEKLLKQTLFYEARGKNLSRDKSKTAHVVYPNTEKGREAFVRKGSRRSDLNGLDTKDGKIVRRK